MCCWWLNINSWISIGDHFCIPEDYCICLQGYFRRVSAHIRPQSSKSLDGKLLQSLQTCNARNAGVVFRYFIWTIPLVMADYRPQHAGNCIFNICSKDSIYPIRPTNARTWIVFLTCYSLPTCFDCCCGYHRGNLQEYEGKFEACFVTVSGSLMHFNSCLD
jgi:hypothetical protein